MRYFIILTAMMVMFGCGEKAGEEAAEKMVEKAIESSFDGEAEVDIEKDSIRIESEEGEMSMTMGDSASLPADFPDDVLIYQGAELSMGMKLPQGFNLSLQTKDDRSKVSEAYLAEMTAKGWTKEMFRDMGEQRMMIFKKDERAVNVTISPNEGMTQITLTVAAED
jgi:outer membrane lipoprotein-sorting protein